MSVTKLPKAFKTLDDVGLYLHKVHGCVDVVGAKVDGAILQLEEVKAQLARAVTATHELAARVAKKDADDALKEAYRTGLMEGVAKTVGAPMPDKPAVASSTKLHRRFGNLKVWQAAFVMFSGFSGALMALKFLDAVFGPGLAHAWHVLINLH